MEKEYFLFADRLKEVESKFIINNEWVKIYESVTINDDDHCGNYCCLVAESKIEEYKKNHHWPLSMGKEGKPAVYGDNTYKTYDEDGLEPFLFYKSFSLPEKRVEYFDVAEEFVLYWKLYEEGTDKQNRTYYYVDDYGETDPVLIIQPNLIKVKLKYLKEYLAIRRMYFVITYDFMRLVKTSPKEWNIKYQDQLIEKESIIYNHVIRYVDKQQSWIIGKVFLKPEVLKRTHFDLPERYESYITGYDEHGELKFESCDKTDDNYFTLTFFKKQVLDKYYNEPTVYEVDGFSVSSKYFRLKIDNNKTDYVPVFLNDLRILSHQEQLHWKQYNIPRTEKMGISQTYYKTMILGSWNENSEAPDLLFKERYTEFNTKWEKKFGWRFYKPLSPKDHFHFIALHLISSNNIKSFCEQTLTIVKLTIDRLNEKELAKNLNLAPNIKGIGKLEEFLKSKEIEIPDMVEFLRNLQSLRSGLIAHTFSEANRDCAQAMKYFNIETGNLKEVFERILVNSIFTLNTLETVFDL